MPESRQTLSLAPFFTILVGWLFFEFCEAGWDCDEIHKWRVFFRVGFLWRVGGLLTTGAVGERVDFSFDDDFRYRSSGLFGVSVGGIIFGRVKSDGSGRGR